MARSRRPPVTPPPPAHWYENQHRREEALSILAEIARRRAEALLLYEPMPKQLDFHRCTSRERLIRGSNRSGKTLAACIEIARAVTGGDPFNKWPLADGRFYIVGKDGKEVGQVLYRKLFKAGALKMIRDLRTGLWRAFRPTEDHYRIREAKAAPPLIPSRFVKSIAWEKKSADVPNLIKLVNGWELSFFSSNALPPKGVDIDGCLFDEEILDPNWYPEISARLLDRSGRFIWSVTPEVATEHLFSLHERAEREENTLNATVREFMLTLDGNPHMSDDDKKHFKETLTDEQIQVKYYGNYAAHGYLIYPQFSDSTYGIDWFPIPTEWTNIAVIDPGFQVCGVLFGAMPPDNSAIHLYDELYIKHCDAHTFGQAMREKCIGKQFHCFLMDRRGGQITDMGSGRSVEEQYSQALKKNQVKSDMGYGFMWGSDDVKAGLLSVRSLLRMNDDGKPKLRVLRNTCDNLRREFKLYKYKRNSKGELTDEPETRNNHLMDCLRYLAAYEPRYVKPRPETKPEGYAVRALREKRERHKKRHGGGAITLG